MRNLLVSFSLFFPPSRPIENLLGTPRFMILLRKHPISSPIGHFLVWFPKKKRLLQLRGAEATPRPCRAATPPSRLFPQFRVCPRVGGIPPALSHPIPDSPVALILALGRGGGGGVALPPARCVAGSLDLRNVRPFAGSLDLRNVVPYPKNLLRLFLGDDLQRLK